jgi:phosphatidate cytidylyltransferase
MNKEINKRIATSIILISLLGLAYFYTYILIILLIIISVISWIEFNGLIQKIFNKRKFKDIFYNFFLKMLCLLYLVFFSVIIFRGMADTNTDYYILYLFVVCICSDIGGMFFGKIFGGKKLTKISPKKTISGSLGSFILSLMIVPIFYYSFENFNNFTLIIILTILISFICQLGDLFISYMKRKAKVKDTGDLLPGHGGILDRVDGILFAVPAGFLIKILIL